MPADRPRGAPDLHDVGRARRVANLRHALTQLLEFLEDPQIVEIMLNADGAVWVDRLGVGLEFTGVWLDAPQAERILSSIAGELELELHAGHPSLACKLPLWGARVQALVPPITSAPIFAFRKPASAVFSLDHYVEQRILTRGQAESLRAAVEARENILIGGGTGSGKTTFANALLQEIATTHDRLLIIEDTPELQCAAGAHRVDLLVHPPLYTWRHAIMDAMRLRPDRIIVGEVRDGAALDLLKAMNTGHPGSVATIHANSTDAMLDRFAQLVDEVIPQYPRSVVASTVHVCVHISRDRKHPAGRVVTGIERVVGFDPQAGWRLEPLAR
jgi:P-type conjugative transfer ATPase TrbB